MITPRPNNAQSSFLERLEERGGVLRGAASSPPHIGRPLEVLDLADNLLGPSGARAVAALLISGSLLRCIDLSRNPLGGETRSFSEA